MFKKKFLPILKVLFFLGLGILLIWLVIKDLSEKDKKDILNAFVKANYFWVIVSIVLSLLSHLSRAIRWKLLLETMEYRPRLSNTFFAVMVGYMANYALPRLGEVSRCGILRTYEKIPFERSFGTVIAERAIDLLCMLLLLTLTIIIQFDKIYLLVDSKIRAPLSLKFQGNHTLLYVLGTGVFMGLILLYLFRKKVAVIFTGKIGKVVLGFLEGLKSVKDIKRPWLFITHSVFIWFMYFLAMYVCFFSFKETGELGLNAALSVLVMGTFGIIFTPGGIGAYQAIVTETLTSAYGVVFSVAYAFSWIVWTSQFITIILTGLISLVLLPLVNKIQKKASL